MGVFLVLIKAWLLDSVVKKNIAINTSFSTCHTWVLLIFLYLLFSSSKSKRLLFSMEGQAIKETISAFFLLFGKLSKPEISKNDKNKNSDRFVFNSNLLQNSLNYFFFWFSMNKYAVHNILWYFIRLVYLKNVFFCYWNIMIPAVVYLKFFLV